MKPSEWYRTFLNQRELDQPDGRHLYEYRIKELEFVQLNEVLKGNPINFDSLQSWDVCFVFYAAEWWRRNYKDGSWTWRVIFESINKSIGATERGQLVEGGLKRWKVSLYKDSAGKNDYLVSIIVEGGLPIETVTRESAWLKRIIKESFNEFTQLSTSEYTIEELVHRNVDAIGGFPLSLQKPEIYTLLGRIIKGLSQLKKEYGLSKAKSAVDVLDQKKQDWRSSFPIQIDSEAGKRFMDELLTEIASIPDPRPYQIMMKRILTQSQGQWLVRAIVDLPNAILDNEDLRIRQDVIDKSPSRLDVVLLGSNGERKLVSTAYKTNRAGIDVFKMSGSCLIEGDAALGKWTLHLSFLGETIDLALPKAEPLSLDSPWIFGFKDGQWLLQGQASLQTQAESLLVVVHNDIVRIEGQFLERGKFKSSSIIEISGDTTLYNSDGDSYRIKTRSASEDSSYILTGNIYPSFSKHDLDIFFGFPSVYKLKSDTLYKLMVPGTLQQRLLGGSNSWSEFKEGSCGLMDIRLLGKGGEILFNSRIGVLPQAFSIRSQSSRPTEGSVFVENSSAFRIKVLGNEITSSINKGGDGHEIKMKSNSNLPPEYVTVSLSRADSQGELKLMIPFPAKGARCFDKDGMPLKRDDVLFLDKLHGARLHLFNSTNNEEKYYFKLSLRDQYLGDLKDVYLKERIDVRGTQKEVPLLNFEGHFRSLFSVSPNLDKRILLEVNTSQGAAIAAIDIKQYSCEIDVSSSDAKFSLQGNQATLHNTKILTFRFDVSNKEQEPQVLVPVQTESNHAGIWTFAENHKPSGVWIVYPSQESEIMFRPIVWSLDGQVILNNPIQSLAEVAHMPDKPARVSALKQLVELMAKDFGNENWGELDLLWKWTNHLPLSVFDVWVAFSESHNALIALLCRQERTLIDRMSLEFPIVWESMSVVYWIEGFKKYKEHCDKSYRGSSGEIIEDRIQYLEKQLNLGCLAEIVRSQVMVGDERPQFLTSCDNRGLIESLISTQYKGAHGSPGLLHHTTDWPEVLREEIVSAFGDLPDPIKLLLPPLQFDHQKAVVYLPAILAYKTFNLNAYPLELSSSKIFKMTMIKSFDAVWFSFIYNLVQGYLWIEKQKTLKS